MVDAKTETDETVTVEFVFDTEETASNRLLGLSASEFERKKSFLQNVSLNFIHQIVHRKRPTRINEKPIQIEYENVVEPYKKKRFHRLVPPSLPNNKKSLIRKTNFTISEESSDEETDPQRASVRARSQLYNLDLFSPLGRRVHSVLPTETEMKGNWCQNPDYEQYCNPAASAATLRPTSFSTRNRYPVIYKTRRKHRNERTYKFSKADMKDFVKTLETGISRESRRLKRRMRPCTVVVNRLTSQDIELINKTKPWRKVTSTPKRKPAVTSHKVLSASEVKVEFGAEIKSCNVVLQRLSATEIAWWMRPAPSIRKQQVERRPPGTPTVFRCVECACVRNEPPDFTPEQCARHIRERHGRLLGAMHIKAYVAVMAGKTTRVFEAFRLDKQLEPIHLPMLKAGANTTARKSTVATLAQIEQPLLLATLTG